MFGQVALLVSPGRARSKVSSLEERGASNGKDVSDAGDAGDAGDARLAGEALFDGRCALVERSFEDFGAALGVALRAFGVGNGPKLHEGVSAAIEVVSRLRHCLDYEATPVLAAYLSAMFEHVLSQLIISRATRDLQSLSNAGYVMVELQKMFVKAHRGGRRDVHQRAERDAGREQPGAPRPR